LAEPSAVAGEGKRCQQRKEDEERRHRVEDLNHSLNVLNKTARPSWFVETNKPASTTELATQREAADEKHDAF
jgi:hypothetical protein